MVLTEQSDASITFETDGRVHGSDGENMFNGRYRFNGARGALRTDHVLSTATAFADPTDEQRLGVAATHTVFARSGPPIEVRSDGSRLELRTREHVLVYS